MTVLDAPEWFTRAVTTPAEERNVRVKGCDIHYLRWGDPAKPALALVHGGAAHAHWWSFIGPQLTGQYHVVAPDLSGHGDSGRRPVYTVETWADEVVAVTEDAGVTGPPILVGHSMGGIVTIAAANLHGERLAGGIVVDSPVRRPDPESEEGERGTMFRNPKTYPDLEQAVAHFHLQPPQPTTNPYIKDFVARRSLRPVEGGWTWKFDPKVFVRHRAGIDDYLSDVRCRIAVFKGQYSDLVTPDVQDYIDELLGRNSPIVEIPEAYHHVPLDQPLALIAALRAILARLGTLRPETPADRRPGGTGRRALTESQERDARRRTNEEHGAMSERAMTTTTVSDEPDESRYSATVDGTLAGVAFYRLEGDVITFTHTEVDDDFEGQGVGGALARHALDDARQRGLRVVARCPFIARWIDRHADYADLVS